MLSRTIALLGTLLLVGPAYATKVKVRAPRGCERRFVHLNPDKMQYLDYLSKPRPLAARGSDVNLADALRALLSEERYGVLADAAGAGFPEVDHVVFRIRRRVSKISPHFLEMAWMHGGRVTKRIAFAPRDPLFGPVSFEVRATQMGYLTRLGAKVAAMGNVAVPAGEPTRHVVEMRFTPVGTLVSMKVSAIEPQVGLSPLTRAVNLSVNY